MRAHHLLTLALPLTACVSAPTARPAPTFAAPPPLPPSSRVVVVEHSPEMAVFEGVGAFECVAEGVEADRAWRELVWRTWGDLAATVREAAQYQEAVAGAALLALRSLARDAVAVRGRGEGLAQLDAQARAAYDDVRAHIHAIEGALQGEDLEGILAGVLRMRRSGLAALQVLERLAVATRADVRRSPDTQRWIAAIEVMVARQSGLDANIDRISQRGAAVFTLDDAVRDGRVSAWDAFGLVSADELDGPGASAQARATHSRRACASEARTVARRH